jgi:uncharacterized DUF497 family protein
MRIRSLHTYTLDKKLQCKYNIIIAKIRFEWDASKAKTNLQKHQVSFREATCVFLDENAIEFYDEFHSEWEDRFLLLGISNRLNLLLICHCYREEHGTIRIISARKATRNEAKHYERR